MKNRKFVKPALIVVAMVLVCVLSILGTLAYLQSTTEVAVNTFTVGNVEITLDEKDVTEYGEADGADRVTANTYKLVPTHEYIKDPTVHVVSGSEKAYVRAFIQVSKATTLTDLGYTSDKVDTTNMDFFKDFQIAIGNNWTIANITYNEDATFNNGEDTVDDGTYLVEVRYNSVVDASSAQQDLVIFDKFTTPDMANDDLAKLAGMTIKVYAQAIQADGFTAEEAFDELPAVTTIA